METNFTVIGGELSVPSASILPSPSSSITMAVGGSVTLTRATPLPSGVTGNLVSKEETVEQFQKMFVLPLSHSFFNLPVDEKWETEEESEGICFSRTDIVVISIGRCLQKHIRVQTLIALSLYLTGSTAVGCVLSSCGSALLVLVLVRLCHRHTKSRDKSSNFLVLCVLLIREVYTSYLLRGSSKGWKCSSV